MLTPHRLQVFLFILLSGCTVSQPEVPAVTAVPAEAPSELAGKVGILPLDGRYGGQVAERIGLTLEECGLEVVHRWRQEHQADGASLPAEAELGQSAAWAARFDIQRLLGGDIVMEGEPDDRYARMMLDVRLVEVETARTVWSHRASFWSSSQSNRAGDLDRAAAQIGAMICSEYGLP